MIEPHAVLIPGGLRWRSVVPLESQGGWCEVIYDLERNTLVEVPDTFQYHIAMALESGNPDETLLGWLASEDLLTYEHGHHEHGYGVPSNGAGPGSSSMTELSELSPAFGCVYFVEDRAHCRLSDRSEQAAIETLDCLLGPLYGVTHLTLHLDGEGGRLPFDRLQRIVEATRSRTADSDREISYELRLDPDTVTPAMASFLELHPFRVRVRCDGPPQPRETLRGLELLRKHLGESLTVHSVLRDGRLLDLWAWAGKLGIEHLHVTRLASRDAEVASREAELRDFRQHLDRICDDMLDALQAEGGRPLLYEPITRVVRRLARDNPAVARSGAPCVGVISHGRVFPLYPGAAPVASASSPSEIEGDPAGDSHPCHGCMARRVCGRGLAADPALSGIERLDIWGRHCDFWRAEIEAGLHFYRRLKQIDPEYLLGLGSGSSDAFVDPLDTSADLFEWKTC